MGEGVRIGGGGRNYGTNVWKKFIGYTPSKTIKIKFSKISTSGSDSGRFRMTIEGADLSEFNESLLFGHKFLHIKVIPMANPSNVSNYVYTFISKGVIQCAYSGPYSSYNENGTYTINESTGVITINCMGIGQAGSEETTYYDLNTIIPENKGELTFFIVNDDPNAYPNGAVHTDGYYYELLGQVSSANVMSLSDNAVAAVQQDYRDTIETEVSNANS